MNRCVIAQGTTDGGGATPEFDYSTTADSGLSLSKPKWGYNKGSVYYKPFEIYPTCSQPFMLILSDVNTSFDADQIPGSLYAKPDGTFFAEDAATPQLGLGTVTDGKSLLNQLTDYIGQIEGVNGNGWFIGESGGSTDFICSAKTVANLSAARGMCPEEPTKLAPTMPLPWPITARRSFRLKPVMALSPPLWLPCHHPLLISRSRPAVAM